MSDEHNIYNILENLDRAQKSVKQLPALFKPDSASPALDGDYNTKNVTRGYLVGESGSYDASMDPEYRRPQSRQVDPDDRDQEPVGYGSSPALQRSPEQQAEFDKYMRHLERRSMREAAAGDFQIGDPVVITGNVQFRGKTGDVREVGRDGAFVVVDLYNYGPHSFHATDVSYNDYADSDDEAEYQQGVAEGSLEEISQDTARSYSQKARASQKDLINQTYRKGADTDKLNKKIQNRQQGQNRAHTDKRYYKDEPGVAEASDISGLIAAASMVRDYIVTAEVDGQTKRFRVRGMTGPRAARERFLKHASQARVIDVKPVAEKNVAEASLNEFDMPVGQATGAAAQINNKPKKTYSVKVVGTFTNPTVFMAKQLWSALEEILPRDYPRVPYQQQHATDPQRRVIDDIRDDGFAIVKQGIKSLDIANTIASNFEARQIPAEVISGGLYEDESSQFVPKAGDEILWRPRNAKMAPMPVTVLAINAEKIKIKLQSPRLIQQRGGKDTMVVSRATSDIMPKPGVTEASPMDNPDFAAGLAAARAGQGPLAIMLAQPSIANDQKMLDTIASSYNLPAGMSAQDIQSQSGSAALRRALDDVARNLGLPTGLSRKELLAAFKKQQSLSESTATTEDVISAVKRKLGDYLQDVATAIKKDPDIIAKIPQDIDQIKAVKTIVTDDGHEIKIHGNEDDGFRVSIKNRDAKTRFKSLDEAAMAAEMYCARRRSQSDSQDYLEEQ